MDTGNIKNKRLLIAVMFSFLIGLSAYAQLEYSPYYTVTITPETKWVNTRGEVRGTGITNICDGVWGCEINNGWGFYSVDGTKIFDYIWKPAESEYPEFHDGVVPAFKKDDDYNTRCVYLLYKDGSVKKLDKKYSACTNFCDGVALAKINYNTYVFIDPQGKEVYPGVTAFPMTNSFFSNQVQSLCDGRRAFYDDKPGKWGFLDENGKIVVEPKYTFVRNFNDGRALVAEGYGNAYFIDKAGKKAFEPQWDLDISMSDISDYNSGYCTVWQDGYAIYYDTSGNEVKAIKFGKRFVDGYAWFIPMKGKDDHENYYIPMDSQFQPVENAYHVPTDAYNGFVNGYMEANNGRIVRPDGGIQIYGAVGIIPNYNLDPLILYDYLGKFNKYGYCRATLKIGAHRYTGFINTKGEMVVVYEWDKREVTEVTTRFLKPGIEGPAKLKEDYEVATIPIQVCSQTPLGPKE